MNPDYSRAIPPAWAHMSKVFTALGDEHRQRILLTFEPGERLNVGQIAEAWLLPYWIWGGAIAVVSVLLLVLGIWRFLAALR